MTKPKYKPMQWVIFTFNTMQYLGQITNAVYGEFDDKTEWRYTVTLSSGSGQLAPEEDILYYFDGDAYVEVDKELRIRD